MLNKYLTERNNVKQLNNSFITYRPTVVCIGKILFVKYSIIRILILKMLIVIYFNAYKSTNVNLIVFLIYIIIGINIYKLCNIM